MSKTNAVKLPIKSKDAAALCLSAEVQAVLTPTSSPAPATTSAPTTILFLWYKKNDYNVD